MTHLSKTLSWLLRHGASECGLELDPEGYANLDTVVEVLRSRKIIITKAAIIDLASAGDPLKQRLQVIGEAIRANYGHSRGTNIQYAAATPPRFTTAALKPHSRRYSQLACCRCSVNSYTLPPILRWLKSLPYVMGRP